MRAHFLPALLASTMVCSAGAAADDLYFGFIRLDPVTQAAIPDSYLVVADGVITASGSGEAPQAGYEHRHDMSGSWALPGFVDAHAHIVAGPHAIEVVDGAPQVTIESRPDITAFHARMALAFGITTVRNPGGDPDAAHDYDLRVRSGDMPGPDALHAGAVVQPPPFGGSAFVYPTTEAEWTEEAARQRALGMTYFKLYHGLTEDELATGIRVAHEHGLQAIAHLDQVSWPRAVELGIDGLLHALPTSADLLRGEAREAFLANRGMDTRYLYQWFEYVDLEGPEVENLIVLLLENEIEVDLTLLVNVLSFRRDAVNTVFPPEHHEFYHPDTLSAARAFLMMAGHGWTEQDYVRAELAMDKVLAFTRLLHERGVRLMIGTDGNAGGPIYAQELQLHADAGIPAWEVLDLATTSGAERLGLGDTTGRLEAGYEADIVFLAANPLEDLANAARVVRTVSNGRSYSRDELTGDNQ